MTPWLIGGGALGVAGLIAYVFYLRWRVAKAEDGEHVWKTKSLQLTKEMTAMVSAANERDARRTGVNDVLRSQLDASSAAAADAALASGDPGNRYVLGSLRQAAAATDAAAHADVPGPAAAGAAPAGDRGGRRGT